MRTLTRLLLVVLFVAGAAGIANAREEIQTFHAAITVSPDAALHITENVTVNVEGQQISRGILRDFPLQYEDADGRTRKVKLDVQSVTRNGQNEPFTTKQDSGVLRVRIGDANTTLPHGVHNYVITYETTRQIRYFDNHDELYWNVTGVAWDFPILKASTEIKLPAGARATDVTYYTGPYGTVAQNARSEMIDDGNRVLIETTQPLGAREGLTAVVAFPKGVVAPLSQAELNADWQQDNIGWIIGLGGLVLVFGFYLWAWIRVGRDPAKGTVVPRWTPPEGVSPALANYIANRGFQGQGWTAFAASLLDLAVKGHLEIDQPDRKMTIRRKGNGIPEGIGVGQRAILSMLTSDGDTLTANKKGGDRIQAVGKKFRQAIEAEHRNKFYQANRLYLTVGVILSIVTLVLIVTMGRIRPETLSTMIGAMLASALIAVFINMVILQFRKIRSLASGLVTIIAGAFFGYALVVMSANIASFLLTHIDLDLRLIAVIAAMIFTNVVYFFIMGAPTPIGQKYSTEIAGLKQYLTLAEKDRMNMRGAPEMSPQHFETLLPYAVALDVEEPWSKTFDAWLATGLAAGAVAYAGPAWYHGTGFSNGNFSANFSELTHSISDSLTASLPTPQSSSSGFSVGGGFSGGGGGGGGGGGW